MPESLSGADAFLIHPSLAGIDRSVESPPLPSASEAGQTDRADLFGRERGSLSFPRSSPRAAHCAPRPSFLMRHAATLPRSSREKQVVAVFYPFLPRSSLLRPVRGRRRTARPSQPSSLLLPQWSRFLPVKLQKHSCTIISCSLLSESTGCGGGGSRGATFPLQLRRKGPSSVQVGNGQLRRR